MRVFYVYIIFFLFLLSACDRKTENLSNNNNPNSDSLSLSELKSLPIIDAPIQNPLKTHKLKLLVTNNINTFYLYKGENLGLEFELLELFLKSKKIDLEIELVKDFEHIRDSLHTRGAHMAAATFIIPKNKSDKVLYSDPIYTTNIVLVKHKENSGSPTKPVVIKDAPYVKHILNADLVKPENISLIYSSEQTSKELLLKQVHSKEIESTIVDENEATLINTFYPDVVINSIIEENAPVGFMFHSKMDTLKQEFNYWLKKNKNTSDYQWIIKKYALLPYKIKKQLSLSPISKSNDKISTYDQIIKECAATINWDWRLVASLIHQESKFNPSTKSWVGACGLMQLMPNTALNNSHISKKKLFIPSYNIKAGTEYLHWIESNFFNEKNMQNSEKQKMILASYNAGAGHVKDAQALCVKHNLDPNVWEGNVEKMILAKSEPKYYNDPVCKHGYCRGFETSTYVKNILFYYKNYSAYFDE